MTADLVLCGGRVITLTASSPVVEAVAVSAGRIVAAGSSQEIKEYIGPQTEVINTQGMTVVPGLCDTHLHLLGLGFALHQVDLSGIRSLEELRQRLAAYIAANNIPPGRWIEGSGWDQNTLAEGRFPTKEDLDGVADENPVLLSRVCHHVALVNRRGLEALGLTPDTPDPEGGRFGRRENGELSGLLYEFGAIKMARGAIPAPSAAELEAALELAVKHASAAGLTEVHSDDLGYSGGFERAVGAYTALAAKGRLPLRVHLELLTRSLGELKQVIGEAQAWQSPSHLIQLGPIKILLDGSLGARTAALDAPYADAPGETGELNICAEELREMVHRAHSAGFQLAIHAIGDRAARLALDAIEEAQARAPRQDARHRLVHCQIMNPALWARMSALGVAGDVQPRFVASDWPMVPRRLGPERAQVSYAWRSMLVQGVRLSAGSDCPVEPLDPLLGLHAAITRTNLAGEPVGGWLPNEKLSPEQALSLFALGAAYVAHAEAERGSIAPGKLADLTVFVGDYLTAPIETTQANDVRLVVSAGRVVCSRF
jgi:predicted amidohydrolase YtcJ